MRAGRPVTASVPRLRTVALADPHVPLAAAVAVLLAGEWFRLDRRLEWSTLAAAAVALTLLLAWRRRERLRLPPLLALALVLQVGWICIHLHLGFNGDGGTQMVYRREGQALLDGRYPWSEYPPGAVALFALETWLGNGPTRVAGAFLMVPFQLLCVGGVWALRTRWSPWLAAFVALWPSNLFFWEFRFDLVPTGLLVLGVALAGRGSWRAAGWALGLGALVKWTPALTAVGLCVWLASSGRLRLARRHALAFALPLVVVYVPLLLLRPAHALAPYRAQGVRGITGESLPYLPLRLLGLARPARHYYGGAHVPSWANAAAGAIQLLLVLGVLALLRSVRNRRSALAVAVLLPAVFLLTNRIFSPQFFVLVVVACAVAGALVVREGAGQVALTATIGAAAVANATLFPALSGPVAENPGWTYASAAALVLASTVTASLIAVAALRSAREQAVDARIGDQVQPAAIGDDRRVLAAREAPLEAAGRRVQRVRSHGQAGEVHEPVDHGRRSGDRSGRRKAPDLGSCRRVERAERVVVRPDVDATVPDRGRAVDVATRT